MSVIIMGMDMPKDGYIDVRVFAEGHANIATGEPPFYKEMPAIEVPPHGDLIDRNFVYSKIRIYADACYVTGNNKSAKIAERIEELIRDVPAIIGEDDE